MVYRTVKQYSDRGSIKDIQKAVVDDLREDKNLPPTTFELRLKSLYEHAIIGHDQDLIDSLGLIVMSGPPNNPVSIMRHREYVNSLKNKKANDSIPEFLFDLEHMSNKMINSKYKQIRALNVILDDELVKVASSEYKSPLRSFRRVS